jgi:chromosomal replication initiator protein
MPTCADQAITGLVIGATSRQHGLTAADLVGPSRCRQVSLARGMAMYLARRLTPKSLESIGAAFGGRDHTTVLHAVRKIAGDRTKNPECNHELHVLEQTLKG